MDSKSDSSRSLTITNRNGGTFVHSEPRQGLGSQLRHRIRQMWPKSSFASPEETGMQDGYPMKSFTRSRRLAQLTAIDSQHSSITEIVPSHHPSVIITSASSSSARDQPQKLRWPVAASDYATYKKAQSAGSWTIRAGFMIGLIAVVSLHHMRYTRVREPNPYSIVGPLFSIAKRKAKGMAAGYRHGGSKGNTTALPSVADMTTPTTELPTAPTSGPAEAVGLSSVVLILISLFWDHYECRVSPDHQHHKHSDGSIQYIGTAFCFPLDFIILIITATLLYVYVVFKRCSPPFLPLDGGHTDPGLVIECAKMVGMGTTGQTSQDSTSTVGVDGKPTRVPLIVSSEDAAAHQHERFADYPPAPKKSIPRHHRRGLTDLTDGGDAPEGNVSSTAAEATAEASAQQAPIIQTADQYPIGIFCEFCKLVKPLRTKHCHSCGRCVMGHDHHCPWIGACVGPHNRLPFTLLTSFMLLAFLQGTFYLLSAMNIFSLLEWSLLFTFLFIILLVSFVTGTQLVAVIIGSNTYEMHRMSLYPRLLNTLARLRARSDRPGRKPSAIRSAISTISAGVGRLVAFSAEAKWMVTGPPQDDRYLYTYGRAELDECHALQDELYQGRQVRT